MPSTLILRLACLLPALAASAGCSAPTSAQVGQPVVPRVATNSAAATLVDVNGKPGGRATLTQLASGVEIVLNVEAQAAGEHGVHVHANGKCEPGPDPSGNTIAFGAAGGHFDPGMSKKHGGPGKAPETGHAGDVPNITVAGDGTGTLRYTHPHATLGIGPASVLGKALVMHAGPDDYRTDPAGNSGARVLCGVIESARPVAPKTNQG